MYVNTTCVIIPAYNEGPAIAQTLRSVLKVFPLVVCVNDGSTDNTASQIAKTSAIHIDHPINMGQGAAIQTGIDFALQLPAVKYFVTFDADGQHGVKDAERMVKELQKGRVDVVLGSRFLGKAVGMPRAKRLIFGAAVKVSNVFSRIKLTDTHNGLRAFNRKFATELRITMSGMGHASEIIDRIGRGSWRYKEMPVTIRYTDYSLSKGQPIVNSVNVFIDLIMSKAHR